MQFIIKAYDGKGKLEKRMEVRPRHLDNMSHIKGKVVCAGGLLDDEGKMAGSVMIMEFDKEQDLQTYLDSEPYILEKVWENIEIEPINVVLLDGKPYMYQ